MSSSRENIRELAALVRTAADASGRAAELMLRWKLTDDDSEYKEWSDLKLIAQDLLNGNELVAKLAADRFRLELAVVESQSLRLACDATTCLHPINREVAGLRAEERRLKLKLNRRGRQRRSTDRP